jgi:predicted nuclease of restriction endonuclease-like (RecB) superfamily
LVKRLASDLTVRFGRGFSDRSLYKMRLLYLSYADISPTLSAKSSDQILQAPSGKSPTASAKLQPAAGKEVASIRAVSAFFPLPWSHYVKLLSVEKENARRFYEEEALRGGWSVRQLDRQISSQFYERTLLSKNKAAMLRKGAEPQAEDLVTPEEEIKAPLVLEFLGLKDEYSEHDLEEALIRKLEDFLLELGGDFTFIGRQKRLRIGNEWYRIDLLFFHRRLRCLIVIDLKIGKFTHADAGQMHLYLNYAREHWTNEGENPPVGLILCAQKDEAVAHYSLEGLPNKVMAAEYRLALPAEAVLTEELEKTQRELEQRDITAATPSNVGDKSSRPSQRRKKKG